MVYCVTPGNTAPNSSPTRLARSASAASFSAISCGDAGGIWSAAILRAANTSLTTATDAMALPQPSEMRDNHGDFGGRNAVIERKVEILTQLCGLIARVISAASVTMLRSR